MNNSPIIKIGSVSFLNVPSSRQLVEEVVIEDCYEIHSLPSNVTFIDLGACYGEASIFAASRGMRCIAVEPSPLSFDVLACNVAINNLESWISVLNLAVGSDGSKTIFYRPDHPAGSSEFDESGIPFVTKTISMESLVCSAPGRIAVKMDIEGSEREVFQSTGWLNAVDFVMMESHNSDSDVYAKILTEKGFSVKTTGTGPSPRAPWDKTMLGGLIIARRTDKA